MTNYQISKDILKSISHDAKSTYRGDKPAIRQVINDSADAICKSGHLTEHEQQLLHNYACKLHPKD
jgi:hypothetical protein